MLARLLEFLELDYVLYAIKFNISFLYALFMRPVTLYARQKNSLYCPLTQPFLPRM